MKHLIFLAAFFGCASLGVPALSAAAPVVTSVVNAANYQPGAASGTWLAIFGTDLSNDTRAWASSDFSGSNLPVSLDGVSVSIGGKAAYVYFISPGQLDVLAPDDAATGTVMVQVTTSAGASNNFAITKALAAPSLFVYSQQGGRYAVAQDSADYHLIAPSGLLGAAGVTVPTAPGRTILLYATGLGPVSPSQPAGTLVTRPAPTATPLQITIGGQPAAVLFAGMIGSGLYQINVTIPPLPDGDAAVLLTINGIQSGAAAYVPVQGAAELLQGIKAPVLTGCVKGQVDYVSYETKLLFLSRPDEISIGGTILCDTCAVKVPLYPELVARIERSMGARKTVEACYDPGGSVYVVRVQGP